MKKVIHKVCAILPVKDTLQAKQRLATILSGVQRQELALAMVTDVLETLAAVPDLAGILMVTTDRAAAALAADHGACVSDEGARDGHTGAVMAGARRLAAEGFDMFALPADIPLAKPADVKHLLDAHGPAPAFTIVPSRDKQGSNAVLCSPADMVPLRFGDNSFYPHLDAARARGIEPRIMHVPHIALDIDTPDDLSHFLATPSQTRTRALLDQWNFSKG